MEVHESLGQDSELVTEVAELRERETALNKIVSQSGTAKRLKTALEKIALFAQRHIPNLDAERPDDPISLSLTDLTIKVKGESREDYLWEVGSGMVVGCPTFLSLSHLRSQEFFLSQKHVARCPVCLVYEASQVRFIFPRRLAGKREQADFDPMLEDEDIVAVRKVFSTLVSAVEGTEHKLQILVLDHAGTDVWADIQGVSLVEEWRGQMKLVPLEWLE